MVTSTHAEYKTTWAKTAGLTFGHGRWCTLGERTTPQEFPCEKARAWSRMQGVLYALRHHQDRRSQSNQGDVKAVA